MQRKGQNLLIGATFCHFLVMIAGAASIDLSNLGFAASPLDLYGALSGANRRYGFFAPGVGSQSRARFEVIEHDGNKFEQSLLDGSSHEADLRVGNIIDMFLRMDDDADDMRRALAASLAGTFFGRHPNARDVVVHLDEFEPVSMAQYRAGERPTWDEIYTARFRHEQASTAGVSP